MAVEKNWFPSEKHWAESLQQRRTKQCRWNSVLGHYMVMVMVVVLFIRADIRDLVVDPQCDVAVGMVVVVVVVVVVVAVVEVTTVGGRMGSSF